jgi:hypothetical protein
MRPWRDRQKLKPAMHQPLTLPSTAPERLCPTFGNTIGDTPAPSQGFLSSFGDQSILGQAGNALLHPIDTLSTRRQCCEAHCCSESQPARMADNPNPIISGVGRQAESTIDNLKQAGQFAKLGNWSGVASKGISAIPILGPALDKATDQYADKNYGGEMGTLTGMASNEGMQGTAPRQGLLYGGPIADAQMSSVPVMDQIERPGGGRRHTCTKRPLHSSSIRLHTDCHGNAIRWHSASAIWEGWNSRQNSHYR